jgi:predicted RNA-binding Zn-ribbon protein involved in translation (DUF1610 family)
MSESDFHISLKGNVEALYCSLNKKKEFYITVQNLTESYMPQIKVSLTGPPEVKILIKREFYGGIAKRNSRNRLFSILPKENGVFTLTANLITKRGHNITIPISVQVGTVQTITKPISLASETKSETLAVKVNCPFCGDKIDHDAKFCPHCGSNIAEKTQDMQDVQENKKCQNCGTELPIEAKFCATCGQKIE